MNIGSTTGAQALTQAPRSDIDSVLAQIKAMRARASLETAEAARVADVARPEAAPQAPAGAFGEKLKSALNHVSDLQRDAGARADDFAAGRSNDLVGTMLALQKSDIAFQATVQVRNRLVSAYQDIMNMPI
ncbi:MAG: flagellar hook-basal body complex protein FliE [Pseudomonadales bacterium]|nr:flagellar hook-basal body complex protein FliE [Pseudomonadales bacterium]MCP5184741.1 flagellar hook-basal body complex protein FliE [Pseudomonadales bacterium]